MITWQVMALRRCKPVVWWHHHSTIVDKSKPPGETDWKKTLVIMDLRFYGNADNFLPPKCNISLVFSLTIVDTSEYFVKNPDSQNIYKAALQYSKIKKPFFFWRANMRMSFLWPDHFFCDFYILFHKLKDKTIFSLIPHYYGLSLLRVSNNASQLFIDLIGWWHGLITGWICFSVILSSNPQLCL